MSGHACFAAAAQALENCGAQNKKLRQLINDRRIRQDCIDSILKLDSTNPILAT